MDILDNALPDVSVIIPSTDESSTIQRTILSVKNIQPTLEVIVVCPGLTSRTTRHAYASGAKVIHSSSLITYDEARALGALHAKGETILFLEEKNSASPALLNKIIDASRKGWDLVLTAYSSSPTKRKQSAQRLAARLLNHISGKTELEAASLCFVPYALNKSALKKIGNQLLCTPPLALACAVEQGLSVTTVTSLSARRGYVGKHGVMKKQTPLILREHAEAICYLMQDKGQRAGLPDGDRFRVLLQAPELLHLRSVFNQEPSEREVDGWGAKRKAKRSSPKKAGRRVHKHLRKK
ncbi:glycosyltransferase [uncultured Brevibacillus sp.]|uniref:glycosyltransferase n=1 Tax=uncultured Brevibacillus sp. TaxID=169970 RepID=UPI0025927B2E|nr:glycosyltransferase [uncultured Brevibacillus sp.]